MTVLSVNVGLRSEITLAWSELESGGGGRGAERERGREWGRGGWRWWWGERARERERVGEGRLKMQYFEFLQHAELKLYNLAAELKAWSIRNMTELRTSRRLQRLREHHDQCARRYEETLLLTQVRHLTLPKLGWVVFIVWPSRQDCSVTV